MSDIKQGLTKLISKMVFKDLVDIEVTDIRKTFISENTITLVVNVDHSKFWRGSTNYDFEYSKLIGKLSLFTLDDELFDAALYFGVFDNYFQIFYEHTNLDVYDQLIDFLKTQDFDFSTHVTQYSPYFGIIIENDYIFDRSRISDAGFDSFNLNIYNRDEVID